MIAAAIDPSRGVDHRLDPALENGVVEVVGDRLRFTHPLLASAVYQKIPPARRRELHARLATIVRDPEERARHLALSVEGPDVAVAAALDEAALLPPPGERRNPRPSSGRWPAAPRRGTEARTWCVGPTRRAWRTTSAGTPRWRGASWSKRWTSRWPGRLGPACCWTWGWASPRSKGGGRPGPCSRLLGARRGTISRCGHRSSRTSGTSGCSGETSRLRNGTLAQRCSWPRSCRNHG